MLLTHTEYKWSLMFCPSPPSKHNIKQLFWRLMEAQRFFYYYFIIIFPPTCHPSWHYDNTFIWNVVSYWIQISQLGPHATTRVYSLSRPQWYLAVCMFSVYSFPDKNSTGTMYAVCILQLVGCCLSFCYCCSSQIKGYMENMEDSSNTRGTLSHNVKKK